MPKSRSSRSKSPQKPLTAAEIATQLEREKIFQNVQEMFKDTVDADVIHMVLTECNWRGEEAIDKLLAIGETPEIQRQYKSKLHEIAEGFFGPLRSDEHPNYGPPRNNSSSLQSSPLSQKDKVIQRPVKVQRTNDSKSEAKTADSFGNSQLNIPLSGLSARGVDVQQPSPDSVIDDQNLDLHFPRLPMRKATLSRSSTSSPISSHRSYSSQVQSGSQPDLIHEAQSAYQQQYDDAAGAQRWEECKNILSDHYLMKSISTVHRSSEDLRDRKNEKAPHISKSRSTEEPSSSMISPTFLDDSAIIQTQTERARSESSRSFPVRLLSRSPDDDGSNDDRIENLDSADLDETVLKCIYEVHDDLLDQALFDERKRAASMRTADLDSERLSTGTPESSGHVTPTPSSQPMTLPVIGLSAHAAEFVPRTPKSKSGEKSPTKTEVQKSPTSKEVNKKKPIKSVRSNSIEIKSGAKNIRMRSPTVQLASASPLGLSPGHSPVISPPSPNIGSPVSNLAGSPMFITPKYQQLLHPRITNTPPPPLRPPVSVISASGSRYITPPPPHHIPPPQFRLSTASHLPFSSRMVYQVAQPPPIFHVAGLSPRMQPIQQPMSPHQIQTSMEERARIATGRPIMATQEVPRHVNPPPPGIAMQLINQPSIEKNMQKIRELHRAGKKVLVIIRGLPGSGKTTLSRAMRQEGVILSTDDYFMKGDMYDYNPDKLAESHQWNRERAKEAIKMGTSPIIIDNTNTQRWEFKPYVSMALNNNYHVEIIEPDTPWKNSPKELARLTVHAVPKDHIQRMLQRYERNITVDMLTIKKKSATPTTHSSTVNQGSKGDDSSQDKGVLTTTTAAGSTTAGLYSNKDGGAGVVGANLGKDWDLKFEAPIRWSQGQKNAGGRSSSLDKDAETLTGKKATVNNIPSISQNGDKLSADKGHGGTDGIRRPPSLHGLNSRAKSLEKSEVLKKGVVTRLAEKKAPVQKVDLGLSEETVQVVEEMVSEYVNNKSLSAEDLFKVEEELKALLQIYPLDDKERVAAEILIGQKLHGAPSDDDDNDVTDDTIDECSKAAASKTSNYTVDDTMKLKKDLKRLELGLASDKAVLIQVKGGLENCAEITNDDIEEDNEIKQYVASSLEAVYNIEKKKQRCAENGTDVSDVAVVISEPEELAADEAGEVLYAAGAIDVEVKYWGKDVEPVSTSWDDDTLEHQHDWSDKVLTSGDEGVRPQRQSKLKLESNSLKLNQDSEVSQTAACNPNEIEGDGTKIEGTEVKNDIKIELDLSVSSKDASEETSPKDYEWTDMNVSGSSSYLTALDHSQSSAENKMADELCDSQEVSEVVEGSDNNSEEGDEAKVLELYDDPIEKGTEDIQDNVNEETQTVIEADTEKIEASESTDTSCSLESRNVDVENVIAELAHDDADDHLNVSATDTDNESCVKVIEKSSLSLLKDSYSDSESEDAIGRSQVDVINESFTENNANSHDTIENAQAAPSIIDGVQDLVSDENQNTIPVTAEEECKVDQRTTDIPEEGPAVKNDTEKRKKPSRKKLAANFHVPFLKDTDKENFSKADWSKFSTTSEHLNTANGNPVTVQSAKIKTCVKNQETMTTEEDFTTLNILSQGGFVESSVHYIISKKRKLVNADSNEVKTNEDDRSISDRYTINQSTSTDDLKSEDSEMDEMVASLKTIFPNTIDDELECVLANCDNNIEWAIDLLLDWNYDSQLSTEEKKDFVVRLEKFIRPKSPVPVLPEASNTAKQPRFLRDLCFNLIEEENIATKEELEQQLILAGKERLDRIEDENLTKIRLRRTSSLSDCSPYKRSLSDTSPYKRSLSERSLNNSGFEVSRSFSSPISTHGVTDTVDARKESNNILKYLAENADVFSPHPNAQKDTVTQENGAVDLDGETQTDALNKVDSLSSMETEEDDVNTPDDNEEKQQEASLNDETFNHMGEHLDNNLDYHTEAEHFEASRVGAVSMKMDRKLVEQLEAKFGPIDQSRKGASVMVAIDHGMAWKLYQCLKHSLADTSHRIQRQMAEDEEFARRLQQEEHLNRARAAENQPVSKPQTGPPPLVGLSGYTTTLQAVKPRPVKPLPPVKLLKEIMEEEAEIQSKEQKFRFLPLEKGLDGIVNSVDTDLPPRLWIMQKLVQYEGGHKVLATLMKRNKLYDRFPDLDRAMLDEVFQSYCFNLTETVSHIESHLGECVMMSGDAGDGMTDQRLLEASKLQSVQDTLHSFLYTPHVSKDYQDGAEPEYEDYRGEANLHHRLRHECFQKAQEAHRRGLKQVASFYSQQGHLHTQKIKEANMRASELILEDRNNDIENNMTLDLHGLHIDETIAALERILPQKQREQRKGYMTIITGRGSHSKGGVARLRPCVLTYLRNNQYNFSETQPGIIKVSLKYR